MPRTTCIGHGIGAAVTALLWLALPAKAQDGCLQGPFTRVASLQELPPQVQRQLGVGEGGFGGIADAGQPFNPSDALVLGVPGKRLRHARMNMRCVVVEIEQGGIALRQHTLAFTRVGDDWKPADSPSGPGSTRTHRSRP